MTTPRLGLSANAGQFGLLVAVTLFVGAMVGLERSSLPLVGEAEFGVESTISVLAFIATFGAAKAVTNLFAGPLAHRVSRKRLLVIGWLFALPVPFAVLAAPSWEWIVAANVLLGLNQGLTWSMAVVMKVDLVGPRRRGLALGLNESAGYGGVALGAGVAGLLATEFAARDVIGAAGLLVAVCALVLSAVLVRDTAAHVTLEQGTVGEPTGLRASFARATVGDGSLRACSQAGFVNNLNDGLMWGVVPLYLAAQGAGIGEVAVVAAVYPAVWGAGQIGAGWLSDQIGRRLPIAAGMLLQAAALAALAASDAALGPAVAAAAILGVGTALVYPTLLAAVSDDVEPVDRPTALGVYRFWRDAGYVAGAGVGGLLSDAAGFGTATAVVAALTAVSGVWAAAAIRDSAARIGDGRQQSPRVGEASSLTASLE